MKDVSSTTFGYVIGFLLPGLVGLYGLAFWSSRIEKIFKPATTVDATVGPSVILLLAAVAVGLILSAIRWLLFEEYACKGSKLDPNMFCRLGSSEKLASFRAVVDEHYRYHQFYGGCFIGITIAYGGWLWNTYRSLTLFWCISSFAGVVVLEILIFVTAKRAYERYVDRGNAIGKGLEKGLGAAV